ncbi:hypothetical protein QWZ10_23655 [Paracoccus cavernae]|uniref:Pyruvate dehydrogenase (acetyl-transferring) n=1 Tax=Paracoccus cavernae TaxID=1571207 RepID=A0ABT8DCG1_9RHOB|nr:hypothetical protein [Paracoccus cavernae]
MSQLEPQAFGMVDPDPVETQEWTEALSAVASASGSERAQFLLRQLEGVARDNGVFLHGQPYSAYRNTIPWPSRAPIPAISPWRSG